MSTLIPSMPITGFRKLKAEQIKRMKSLEVYSDGVLLFTAIIPKGDASSRDYAIVQGEYLGMRSNIVGGLDPAEVIKDESHLPV